MQSICQKNKWTNYESKEAEQFSASNKVIPIEKVNWLHFYDGPNIQETASVGPTILHTHFYNLPGISK